MSKQVTIQQIMSSCDYLEMCGTGEKLSFSCVNDDENTILATSEKGKEYFFHLYDTLVIEDRLIILDGQYYEAFKITKVLL